MDSAVEERFFVRLKGAIGQAGGVSAVHRATGIPVGTLNKYAAGSSVPSFTNAAKIAVAAGITLGDLAGEPPQVQMQSLMVKGELPAGFVPVPLLDVRPSAGPGSIALQGQLEPDMYGFREEWLRRIGVSPRAARLMVAKGDSMHDTISDGDLMIVDVSIRAIVDEGVYVVVFGGMVLVKRVQILRTGAVLLKSDNGRYGADEVAPHELPELIIEGRVRWAGGSL